MSDQSPAKRPRAHEPAAPASVISVLKQTLGPYHDVSKVDFQNYALIVQGRFGYGSTVYDFGGRMWLVPASLLGDESRLDEVYCLEYADGIPPKLLSELTEDRYKLEGNNVGSILTWAARCQLGDIVVVGDQ